MGAAGELIATGKGSKTHQVPASQDAGKECDSHSGVEKKARLLLIQRGIPNEDQLDQAESSDDEDEIVDNPSAKAILSPISRSATGNKFKTASKFDAGSSQTNSNDGLQFCPSSTSRLNSVYGGSDDESTRSSTTTCSETQSVTPNSRRHVSSSSFLRNQSSRLQQQLGILPNASLQSLMSSLTTSSGSSSSSTATQKSYDKLAIKRRRPTRRNTAKQGERELSTTRPVKPKRKANPIVSTRRMVENILQGKVDGAPEVRANMSRPASNASRASRKDSVLSPPTPARRCPSNTSSSSSGCSHRSKSSQAWKPQSTFNSDSGISMTSSPDDPAVLQRDASSDEQVQEDSSSEDDSCKEDSPEGPVNTLRTSPVAGIPMPSSIRALPDTDPFVQRLQDQEAAMKHHMLHSPQPKRSIKSQVQQLPSHRPSPALPLYEPRATSTVPSDYPLPPPLHTSLHNDQTYIQPYYHAQDHNLVEHGPRFQLDMEKQTIVGYELLAEKLSHRERTTIKPMYRRFEKLNHRILLHLQDEIAELEEELRALDETVAQSTAFELPADSSVPPASRRADARYGSNLHYQRTQILGKIFMKIQQYNQALSSFSAARKDFTPARAPDVSNYRTWMEENVPVHSSETQFLSSDNEDDLICPPAACHEPHTSHSDPHRQELRQLIHFLYMTMALLLLAFSMIPGSLSKVLFFLFVVGCMGGVALRDLPVRGDNSMAGSKGIA